MQENQQLIHQFYSSFQSGNHQGMQECYHPEVDFSDSVFTDLKGNQARAMWHMLLSGITKENPLKIEFKNIQAGETEGSAEWDAYYNFSLTGRKVHNIIKANFRFKDGKIINHIDYFDFWRWSREAFGFKGLLLGWTPFFQNKVKQNAAGRLRIFIEKNPQYQ